MAIVPHGLTALRLLSAPALWWLVATLRVEAALVCLAGAMVSDAVDGILARRLGIASSAGAYFDATADFAVIVAGFAGLAAIGVYPAWPVALIGLVFVVFLASSWLTPTIHDPLGRHIGGILYVALAVALLLPDMLVQGVILATVTGALTMTLAARAAYTVAQRAHRAPAHA